MAFFKGKGKPKGTLGDPFFDNYEAKLKRARALAFVTTLMYSFNWFLGFCALTWASAVVLGGLLTDLSQHDYFSVVALLVLEAVRLSTATFFGKFVHWMLVHGSTDPQRLIYNDAPRQKLYGIARIFEQALQFTVIDISILVPVRRLQDLKVLSSSFEMTLAADEFDGLKTSLLIFYVLVLVNGAIAGLAVIFSKNVVPFFVDSFCLQKYYEAVVWKGMDEGLLHATDFEMLSWTFRIQADEYRRNTRAWVVKELYGDMMKFLYYHPRFKGFEAASVALDSHDTFEREAAANIVGLWVSLVVELEGGSNNSNNKKALARLLMQQKLLAKLADALDNNESGRAACLSFVALVEKDPEFMLTVRSDGRKEMLADILMDRIHETVQLKKPNNALVYIKAMIPLIKARIQNIKAMGEKYSRDGRGEECPPLPRKSNDSAHQVEHLVHQGNGHALELELDKYCPQAKLDVMKRDMWIIVTKYKSGLKRLQAVAAYAYNLLMTKEESRNTDLRAHLRVEPEDRDSHILKDEVKYLFELLDARELPSEWKGLVEVRAIENHKKKSLPGLARRDTALLTSSVNLSILVVSSIFIMRYGHF